MGLGRFGGTVARSLVRLGHEVLAIDGGSATVQHWSQVLTHVVQADATDQAALRQLGLGEFDRAIVAIGSDLEASVLAVLNLAEIGVPQIWARASTDAHARILRSVGAQHVLFPEAAMGERVAHLIVSRLLDFVEFGDDFAIAKTRTPPSLAGRRIGDLTGEDCHGVVVIGVHGDDSRFVPAHPDTVIPPDGALIVEGTIDAVQRFSVAD
ncbi:potassium channel family protein [Plantactinospora siamensis]|uniref:Potassium channel family protein n=1 Tax=Plantactinospora siamensis TaxID=555372 RepID=A0ABV6NWI3_9ACTN